MIITIHTNTHNNCYLFLVTFMGLCTLHLRATSTLIIISMAVYF